MKTDNELIAEFMGHPMQKFDFNYPYMVSWDSLMPVVEKINSLPKTGVSIYPHHCIISVDGTAESGAINHGETMPLIQIVYPTVVKFIKWYNNQQGVNSIPLTDYKNENRNQNQRSSKGQ